MRPRLAGDALGIGRVGGLDAQGIRPGALAREQQEVDVAGARVRDSPAGPRTERGIDDLLMALGDVASRYGFLLGELGSLLGRDSQLLATVEQLLGQLALVRAVIAVEEGLVSARDDELGDVHPSVWTIE